MSANQACFPIATMARVLGVAKAGFHAWRQRPPSSHAVSDAALPKRIRTVHAGSRQTHGAPRVHADPRGQGERHGRKRIARLMREAGLLGACHRHGGPTTTRRDKDARPAPDLVDRNLTASGPNQLWAADITYVPTAAGFPYPAVVLDAWSRRIVGWSMANHLRAELVLDAMEAAVGRRRPKDVIHHSDQGGQYTSVAFGRRCGEAGVRPSMGSVGDAYDNAMAESFFSTLEAELPSRRRFMSQAEARMACFRLYRGPVQPGTPALRPGLPVTDGLRSREGGGPDRALASKPTNCPRERGNLSLPRVVLQFDRVPGHADDEVRAPVPGFEKARLRRRVGVAAVADADFARRGACRDSGPPRQGRRLIFKWQKPTKPRS